MILPGFGLVWFWVGGIVGLGFLVVFFVCLFLFFSPPLPPVVSQELNFLSEVFQHLSVSSRVGFNGEPWATFLCSLTPNFFFQQNADLAEIYIRIISRGWLVGGVFFFPLLKWKHEIILCLFAPLPAPASFPPFFSGTSVLVCWVYLFVCFHSPLSFDFFNIVFSFPFLLSEWILEHVE